MAVSVFSFLTALTCFDFLLMLFSILRRKDGVFARQGFWCIIVLLALGVIRLICPITLPDTIVLHSTRLMPAIQSIWQRAVLSLPLTVGDALLILWVTGSLVQFIRLVLYLKQDYKTASYGVPITDEQILSITRECSANIRVKLTDQFEIPVIAGFFHPVILLPRYLQDFSDEEIRLVIRHEAQHFHRRHQWLKLAVECLICLFWWNPPVYLLRGEINQMAEIDCDRQVTRGMDAEQKAAYLQTIVKSIRRQAHIPAQSTRSVLRLSGSGMSNLSQRFQLVASQKRKWPAKTARLFCMGSMLFMLAVSPLVVVQPFKPLAPAAMADLDISALDSLPGTAYIAESKNGEFIYYIYGEPVFSFEKIVYAFLDNDNNTHYVEFGKKTNCHNYLTINAEDDYLVPIYLRNRADDLVRVSLPIQEKSHISPERSADKNEFIEYFRYDNDGNFQKRVWSLTYLNWINNWENTNEY